MALSPIPVSISEWGCGVYGEEVQENIAAQVHFQADVFAGAAVQFQGGGFHTQ